MSKKKIGLTSLNLAIIALTLLGIGTASYLAYEHYGSPIICIGEGCSIVDQSIYSELFGIPMSVLGLAAYLAILGLALWEIWAKNPLRYFLRLGLYGLSLVGMLYSAYLTYLELFKIHAICTWCVASAVTITVIFILSALNLRRA